MTLYFVLCSAAAAAQNIMPSFRPMGEQGATSFHQMGMPPHLLRLFEARPAPPFMEKPRRRKPLIPYSGVGKYLHVLSHEDEKGEEDHLSSLKKLKVKELKDMLAEHDLPTTGLKDELVARLAEHLSKKSDTKDTSIPQEEDKERLFINPELALQVRIDGPTRVERMVESQQQKHAKNKELNEEALKLWDPQADPNIEGEALNTLFVANLSHEVSERKLKREFESFGPIKRIRLVHDKFSGKPKGYAFIEFEEKEDMKEAYKVADGMRIEGKRCVIDVERGRTVHNWRPKRLGGGKTPESNVAILPRDPKKQVIAKMVNKALGVDMKPPVDPLSKRRQGKSQFESGRVKRDRYDDGRSYGSRYDSHSGRGRERDYRPRSWDRHDDRRHGDGYGSRERHHDGYDDRRDHHRSYKRERVSYDDDYRAAPPPEHPTNPQPVEPVDMREHSPEEGELQA